MGRLGSLMPARAHDGVGHRAHRLVLPHHAVVKLLLQAEELLHLAFHQLRDRDARPPRDDLGDVFLVDLFLDEPATAPGRQRRFRLLQLALEGRQRAVLQLGGAREVARPHGLLDVDLRCLDALAQLPRPLDRRLLALPLLTQGPGVLLQPRQLLLQLPEAIARGGVGLLLQRFALDLQLHHASGDLVELCRHGVDLRPQTRRRLVDEIDGLVGQEPVGDIAVRQDGR